MGIESGNVIKRRRVEFLEMGFSEDNDGRDGILHTSDKARKQ